MPSPPLIIERVYEPARSKDRASPTSFLEPAIEAGRVPRVARLMALAIRFERLVRSGEVRDYAQLARLGRVTPARITQIMNLLVLAPDIQEEILFLPLLQRGRDPIHLAHLQPIARVLAWSRQRVLWAELQRRPAPRAAPKISAEFHGNRLEVGWRSR
jgi:hypothetical protein